MVRALVLRAAGVGALAGVVAFVFARIFAEPLIQAAIDYEAGRAEAEAALAAAAGQAPSAEGPELSAVQLTVTVFGSSAVPL